MRGQTKRVLVLELNEITWDLMEPLMERGVLPNFQAMMREGAAAAPWASEESKHLDPWVTWTTLYTGVPQEEHGLAMLEQDRESLGAKRVWEYFRDAGLRLGMFGSANSWPPQPVDGYWVPGSFSRDYATYPRELEPIQAMNIGLTRGHTVTEAKKPRMATLLPKLLRLGLTPRTILRVGLEMLAIRRNPRMRWRMVALQPVVNLDLFGSLYRRHRPHFATLHSNHVAYYMHRFWRAMEPERFEVPPSEEERTTYGDAIEHGYRIADEMLGKLRKLAGPDVNVVIVSSCGQQPATGGRYSEDHRRGNVGLQIRIKTLLDVLGIADRVEYSNLMAPQWKVDFAEPQLLASTVERLRKAWNVTRERSVFAAHVESNSICLGAHREQQLDDILEIETPSGPRRFRAAELLDRHAEVVKSGKHHPKGVLLMSGPDVRRGVRIERCDNLDIAPTLMTLMGQPVPPVMRGRLLREALLAGEGALAAV